MEAFNRREFLIRSGLVRPPMISAEQKARFVAACFGNPELERVERRTKGSDEVREVLRWVAVSAVLGTLSWIALVGAAVAWL